MKRFLAILVVLGLIAAGIVEWGNAAWDVPGLPARSGNQTVVLIPPHTRSHAIVGMLQDAGVVKYSLLFELDLRLRGLTGEIRAGEYAIPSRASMAAIAGILIEGKSIQHKLTAAEGLTSDMIWKLVRKDPVLVGDAGPAPAEGTLLPETYLFTRGQTRAGLLDKMRLAQERFIAAHWAERASGLPFTSAAQAVTLASIVEKETALPDERRHIAAVFVNRLKAGMKLQSDPTIIYGLTKGYPLGRGIRQSEIAGATPYNTYAIAGLPPGPICNPGKDSLAAVLNPASSSDLYFVANGKGGHVFAATIAEHLRNVAAFRVQERIARHEVPPADTLEPVGAEPGAALPKLPSARKHRVRHR